jgi:hypothetical protein
MKTVSLFLTLSLACFAVMIIVDYFLGPKAEFLNAYSVIERLMADEQSVEHSLVARKFGESGELVGVLVVNMVAAAIVTTLIRFFVRTRKTARPGDRR